MTILLLCIPFGIFLGELFIKSKIENNFLKGREQKICGGKILIRKSHNSGAFLNAFEKMPILVGIVSLILCIVLTVYFVVTMSNKGNLALRTGLAFLLGGAYANTYDRIKKKYVVDYFSFVTKSERFNKVVFNIGDFCIAIGAFLIVTGKK